MPSAVRRRVDDARCRIIALDLDVATGKECVELLCQLQTIRNLGLGSATRHPSGASTVCR